MPRTAADEKPAKSHSAAAPPYIQSIDGCLDDAIGKHGLSDHLLSRYLRLQAEELDRMKTRNTARALPILRIAEDEKDIDEAEAALAKLSEGAETIVFFGTGGSGLGGQTLAQFGGWNIPGVCPKPAKGRPRVRFYDNLDGDTLGSALKSLDLDKTRFVVISKSGGTSETLAQAITTLSAAKAAGLGEQDPRNCSSGSPSPPAKNKQTACAPCSKASTSPCSTTTPASAAASPA